MRLTLSSVDIGPHRFTVRTYPSGKTVILCGDHGSTYKGVNTAMKLNGLSHQEVLNRLGSMAHVYLSKSLPAWPEWRRDRPQNWGRTQATLYKGFEVYMEILTNGDRVRGYTYVLWLIDFSRPFHQSTQISGPQYATREELENAVREIEETVPALVVEQIL